ncbi:MAG: Tn7 transposase TnsA N-terminal domain-containing protein [Tannerellaceae bacterium]|nr:Tn7 transposase TnsA N-terminal domain-containing protein [Tannerellaceae bacterium]
MASKKQDIFKKVLWFDKRIQFDIPFFDFLQPQRMVSEDPRYISGTFYSEKCKRHIQYESGLELAFIKILEASKRVIFYYEQPVQISYWKGRRKQIYTPDFGVFLDSKEFVIVEVKDLSGMLENRVQIKMEGLLNFCSVRGFGLLLTNGKDTIDKFRKVKCNRNLEKEILRQLTTGHILRRKECNELIKKHGASRNEFLKIILKNHLTYRSYPFKLQQGKRNEMFHQVFIQKKKYDDLITDHLIHYLKK